MTKYGEYISENTYQDLNSKKLCNTDSCCHCLVKEYHYMLLHLITLLKVIMFPFFDSFMSLHPSMLWLNIWKGSLNSCIVIFIHFGNYKKLGILGWRESKLDFMRKKCARCSKWSDIRCIFLKSFLCCIFRLKSLQIK